MDDNTKLSAFGSTHKHRRGARKITLARVTPPVHFQARTQRIPTARGSRKSARHRDTLMA